MVEVIGVRFNSAGKIYYFEPKGQDFSIGTNILVETARGVELGHVVIENKEVDASEIVPPLRPIIRVATEEDYRQVAENKEKEKDAFIIANEKVREHKLDMKLVDVEYTFDRSKILFYFTAAILSNRIQDTCVCAFHKTVCSSVILFCKQRLKRSAVITKERK